MHLLDTLGDARLPITLHSAEGALLWDTGGRDYWDFYGGHAVTLIGNSHPRWVDAIQRQARLFSFCTTIADVAVRDRAAEKLAKFTGMDVLFLVNSGAEANEAALKIARKATGRPVIVAMEAGFHGRSMGALGVTWGYRDQHRPVHGSTRFAPFGDLAALERLVDEDVAAVILEPIQGIAGVQLPPPGYLKAARDLCRERGAMLICDEVQCGMGRTGDPLVSVAQGADPDLVTVGKGVGGGFPAAAVMMTRAVAATVRPGEHGTTFGGAPLACAAIEATLDIIEEEGLLAQAKQVEGWLREHLAVPGVVEIRAAGAWAGVQLDASAKPVMKALLERGFLVGTSGDPCTLRLAPPARVPEYAVKLLGEALADVLAAGAASGAA